MPGTSFVCSTASSSTGGPRRSPTPGEPSARNDADRERRSAAAARRRAPSAGSAAASAPGSPPRSALRGLHQSETSKKPIQPSSVNSDWCAWNMYLPAYGKRISRIPRWPWHSMTVSVYSLGVARRPGREVVKEVAVQVKRVEQVVLEDVDEVQPHELVALDLDRALAVGEADRVGRVQLVGAVEVRVEAVHDHDELVGLLALVLRIDDERAVQALGDVLGERAHVAVVEVQAERQRVELVDRRAARARPRPRRGRGRRRPARVWMPWKWIVCGCVPPLTKRIRSRSPSVARSVGPGMRPL